MRGHCSIGETEDLIAALSGRQDGHRLAPTIIALARTLGVDPIAVLAHRVGISRHDIHVRIAGLLGLRYCDDMRPHIAPFGQRARLDALAGITMVRSTMGSSEMLFVAPGLDQIRTLARFLDAYPHFSRRIAITSPERFLDALGAVNADALLDEANQRLVRQFPYGSAHLELSDRLRWGFVIGLAILVVAALIAPFAVQIVLVPLITIIMGAPSIFRLWAAGTAHNNLALEPGRKLTDAELPVYSVLIPLRDEANMVRQIADAMARLDYPPEKLDIRFVVESTSPKTVMAVRRVLSDPRFSLSVVPRRPPHTKPKALNFALPLLRGRYVVVFDAEDVPEPDQLRKAASVFAERSDLACLQAELRINPGERGWISRMFTVEYAGHFCALLPAIARAGLPMPLGGTSNHFPLKTLMAAGGWDGFNVTEDADLGVRMSRLVTRKIKWQ